MIRGRRSSSSPSSRDHQLLERLVRQHSRAVRAYAHSVASTATIAEDAAQETFVRAWKYLDSFRGTGSREGWLLRICRNAVYDLEARERRGVPVEQANVVRLDSLTAAGGGIAAVGGDPVDDGGDVIDVINELPVVHREVLVLCGLLGYSYEDAAGVLDVPIGTVRSRLSRARLNLDERLATAERAAGPLVDAGRVHADGVDPDHADSGCADSDQAHRDGQVA